MFYQTINNHPPHPGSDLQGVIFVDGIEEAKSYSIPFGSRMLFMDKNEDVFYIRDVNFNGAEVVSTYRFERVEPPKPPEYVTKSDLEDFMNKVLSELRGHNESAISEESS